ncbi:MAG: serine dehydratase [Ruminococcaceae bacterium]|nr:serine dehydratase [Oscillospiraceae bacterium]
MESLKELYRFGKGPSSSHTMGPEKAAIGFLTDYPDADFYRVTLYGSLAKTGKGHLTDEVLSRVFGDRPHEIVFDLTQTDLPHPNTMDLEAVKDGKTAEKRRVISVGGGRILLPDDEDKKAPDLYPHRDFAAIKQYCQAEGIELWQYAERYEGPELWDFLRMVWKRMKDEVRRGLAAEGVLAGGLEVERKAKYFYSQKKENERSITKETRLVCSYAYAAAEENAAGGEIVTAPTCGSCGVVPAVLVYMQEKKGFFDEEMIHALATGGVIGNVIKTNASISGAECGCQAEIGSACSMASAALAQLFGMDLDQIEYAAEVALEHHLGLTCDPILGLVQIPCIERNAVAAMRALNTLQFAHFLTYKRKISFDTVVKTMYQTGLDLFSQYKETSEGGLATMYCPRKD